MEEYVFGFMEQTRNGLKLTRAKAKRRSKSKGIVRATGINGLIKLTLNLFHYEQVIRLNITA